MRIYLISHFALAKISFKTKNTIGSHFCAYGVLLSVFMFIKLYLLKSAELLNSAAEEEAAYHLA